MLDALDALKMKYQVHMVKVGKCALIAHFTLMCKRGDALGFFEHPFCCKISKIDGRNNKKFGKNQSHSAEKKEESLSVEKSGPFCFGMAFYLMLEALDALKMKY